MAWLKLPLSLLSDPAFSADPRTHPHFPLASATSFKPFHPPTRSSNAPRRASVKALVRRLTSRHKLDRIDELDETDPFGGSHHHDGPYEATSGNHVQSARDIHRTNREFNPRSLHPTRYRSFPQVPILGKKGLSLHLEPGQILQHNTIYASHVSSITTATRRSSRQPDTLSIIPPSDLPRTRSPPNPQVPFFQDSPNNPPSQCFLGENAPDTHDNFLPRDYHHAAPYIPNQTETTPFPPPRYESRPHIPGPPPPFKLTSHEIQSAALALPPHAPRDISVRSLDSSHTTNSTVLQPSTALQNTPFDPRTRHLPKRLVMPAPLQPQSLQPQCKSPSAEPVALQNEYPNGHTADGMGLGQSAVYIPGSRLLRKKSTASPVKTPLISYHVPIVRDDPILVVGNASTKPEKETEGTKEKIRRRRLSKRKNDI